MRFPESMKFLKKYPLDKRLNLLAAVIMLPLTALILYLLVSLINFSNAYSQSVRNITAINKYSLDFKTDLDYSMYRAIIGNLSFKNLNEEEANLQSDDARVRNPYTMINELHGSLTYQIEESDSSHLELLSRIDKSLGWLERVVRTIDDNIEKGSHYEENMDLLENDIRSSTALIQENLQEYIYYETSNLENIRHMLEDRAKDTLILCTVILLILLVLILSLTRMITQSVTKPIRELCRATKQVAKGNFSHAEIESGDEIQVLTNSFNDMTGEIQYLIENIKKEQKNLRDTELKLLQAQINPHFLYNTLDAIVWMAEGGMNKEVVFMVTALSEFFRTTLSEGNDYITIREEESHIRSYLSIQEVRYADIMEYEISIDAGIYPYYILKLTLQPLVENALYHGIKNKRGKGKITVRGYERNDRIYLEVEDNGIGMTEEELEILRKKVKGEAERERGFGLGNVDERIRLNYGPEFGISFQSKKGEGTLATVCIPKKITLLSENNQLTNS
ncbi:MAG: sensor histidine kinase [Eubacteriales bacterium]|nr:sensor histidine kinase [Eubacteriales bacterium]